MDKAEIISNVKRYAIEVQKELRPDAIVLFGSYANDTATEDSDIDVAVIVNELEGDRLEAAARLSYLTWDIDTRIEPILLDKSKARISFVNEVLRTGELITV
ncbi:MAG: nucleotidyltransferase domain-containing protein [Oscillospiraceae bacterium]|nr:nucleotidyltransferase domain-containing protein [Oscillospiraceae bacterium]